MNLKKKVIFGMIAGFFVLATVFNMSLLKNNGAGDVSLDAIAVMAQANPEVEETKWVMRMDPYDCSGEYVLLGVVIKSWSCTNCAWSCESEEVSVNDPVTDNCESGYTCYDVEEDNTIGG